jgi:hypothetical protein
MTFRACSHEARRNHSSTLETPPLVKRLAVHEPSRALPLFASTFILHHEPLRKAPCADAPRWFLRIDGLGRRLIQPWCCNSGHDCQLLRKTWLDDFLEIARPGVKTTDDGGVPRQID